MSIIQKIRDRSAVLVFSLILLSLVAFILQDAFVGKTSSLLAVDRDKVGEIGGRKILKKEFDLYLDNYQNTYKSNGIDITEELKANLMKTVWDGLILVKGQEIELEKMGMTVSSKEFEDLFFGSDIHPYIKQQFTDPNTNEFNEQSVRQYLSRIKSYKSNNPDRMKFLEVFVKPILENELSSKLNTLLVKSIYFPKVVKDKFESFQTQRSNVKLVAIPYSSISDSLLDTNDKELKDYIKNNYPNLINTQIVKTLGVASFKIRPSNEDTINALNKIYLIKKRILSSKGDNKILLYNSLNNRSSIFLHLSDYNDFEKKHIANLKYNEVVGPYFSDKAYHIFKLIDKKYLPDSVYCRHIFISDKEGKRSDKDARKLIDSVFFLLKSGVKFSELVSRFSEDDGSKKSNGEYMFSYKQYGNLVPEFSNFIFGEKVGEKKIVKTSLGYHYIEILYQSKKTESFKVGIVSKNIDASKATIDSVYKEISSFISKVNNSKEFYDLAMSQNITTKTINVSISDFNTEIGYSRPLVKWAFESKVNDISNIISVKDNVYVSVLVNETPEGEIDLSRVPINTRNEYRRDKKHKLIAKKNIKCNNLDDIAKNNNQVVKLLYGLSLSQDKFPEFYNEPNFIAATFDSKGINKLKHCKGNTGSFYFTIDKVYTSNEGVANVQERYRQFCDQFKNDVSSSVKEYYKKQYKVEDLLSNFY